MSNNSKIRIRINGKAFSCEKGDTIMKVAHANKIRIPGLCGHPDFKAKANCRLCVVEVKGKRKLLTACSTAVEDGMEVVTDNERIKKTRDTNLELIFAEHIEKCGDCIWRYECKLLGFAREFELKLTKFSDRKGGRQTYRFANAVEIDGTQCIDCRNCVDACSLLQKLDYLEIKGKGADQEIVPSSDPKKHCILCGQCTVHCPVSSAQEQAHWLEIEKMLKNPDLIAVAQIAPSVRVSIGEDFGLPPGSEISGEIIAGLRALGFKYVFDVNFGADITTIVEAQELLERLSAKAGTGKADNQRSVSENSKLPMFTSCCPGWVNYVEFYRPGLIPNLTTSRSPHIHNGGLAKTFWAKKMNIDPKKIVMVSLMPCTAKKYEASREEMKIDGNLPVDIVITAREFSFMIKKNNIDLLKLKKSAPDSPLGEFTGGAAIFGGSGGVMESALRTAHVMACGDRKGGVCRAKIDFKDVRGMDGIKEAEVEVAGNKLRVAVVNGIGNIRPILDNLDNYDYIEVMACPGGCIGGGGQPIPTTPEIKKKRIEALYRLDKGLKIRKSYDNKSAQAALDWLKDQGHELEHDVLHTKYAKKTKY